jgi:hypothetical protein
MKAQSITSDLLDKILGEIDPVEFRKVENKMVMASRISNAMKEQEITLPMLVAELSGKKFDKTKILDLLAGCLNPSLDLISELEIILKTRLI